VDFGVSVLMVPWQDAMTAVAVATIVDYLGGAMARR
jgi:hypothetical protein